MRKALHARRRAESGVTLVEILVVLVIVALAAGAVGLAIGPATRTGGVDQAAELLAARLNRAADEVILTGQPMAFVWTAQMYRFEMLQDNGWVPHPVPILGKAQDLDGAVRLTAEPPDGAFVVQAASWPASGTALSVTLEQGSAARTVIFDGLSARIVSGAGL